MDTKLMFPSETDEWATPIDFFEKLNKEFNPDRILSNAFTSQDSAFSFRQEGLLATVRIEWEE